MALNPVYADFGLQIAQGFANFMIGSINANLQAKLTKYRNEIIAVQASMNSNRVTMNEIAAQDATVRTNWAIQLVSASDRGSAEVNAAAAGSTGRNVENTMRGLRRSAAFAQTARKSKFSNEMAGFLSDRRSNEMSRVVATDISTYQGPSILSAFMGVGMSLLDTYQKANPARQTSIVGNTPSGALGLGASTSGTLLGNDPDSYWKWNTGPNG